jgi:hypothetical protein
MGAAKPVRAVAEAKPAALTRLSPTELAERRKHGLVHNYWMSLRGDRKFPSIWDLDPFQIADAGANSVMLDLSKDPENPEIFVGEALRYDSNSSNDSGRQADAQSLLSCVLDNYRSVLEKAAPIAFEDECAADGGRVLSCFGTLLPFSSTGQSVDYVFGLLSWRDLDAEAGGAAGPALVQTAPVESDGLEEAELGEEIIDETLLEPDVDAVEELASDETEAASEEDALEGIASETAEDVLPSQLISSPDMFDEPEDEEADPVFGEAESDEISFDDAVNIAPRPDDALAESALAVEASADIALPEVDFAEDIALIESAVPADAVAEDALPVEAVAAPGVDEPVHGERVTETDIPVDTPVEDALPVEAAAAPAVDEAVHGKPVTETASPVDAPVEEVLPVEASAAPAADAGEDAADPEEAATSLDAAVEDSVPLDASTDVAAPGEDFVDVALPVESLATMAEAATADEFQPAEVAADTARPAEPIEEIRSHFSAFGKAVFAVVKHFAVSDQSVSYAPLSNDTSPAAVKSDAVPAPVVVAAAAPDATGATDVETHDAIAGDHEMADPIRGEPASLMQGADMADFGADIPEEPLSGQLHDEASDASESAAAVIVPMGFGAAEADEPVSGDPVIDEPAAGENLPAGASTSFPVVIMPMVFGDEEADEPVAEQALSHHPIAEAPQVPLPDDGVIVPVAPDMVEDEQAEEASAETELTATPEPEVVAIEAEPPPARSAPPVTRLAVNQQYEGVEVSDDLRRCFDEESAEPAEEISDDDLRKQLTIAQAIASAAPDANYHSRAALYVALGHAYDFALAAEALPQTYGEILAETNVEFHAQAPMLSVVELVFGPDYDGKRLNHFAAALSWARRANVAPGSLASHLEFLEAGLAIVSPA